MPYVNRAIKKKDYKALVTGKPVFTDDLAPKDCLIVKLLRSPHAHANIVSIKKDIALKVPGIEAVFTYEDVPKKRFTLAGQTYPEASPYDRYILDPHLRFVGDPVAIVAGQTEEAVDRALKMIKVQYEVLEPILDFHKSKDNDILIHPEEDWIAHCNVGADNKRNLCAQGTMGTGDIEAVLEDCDVVLEETYHTKANQQTMMETFRTYCYMDVYSRLNIVSSTQIAFHVRRIVSHALCIPKSKIRVIKPRIGGGFGAKQTAVCEVYPAFVTWMTGKPAEIIYTRYESQIASSPRHEMEVKVRIGASKEGLIRAIDLYTLSNTGAYGEHGPTTVGLSGHKSIPLYGKTEAYRFSYDVVYSNVMSAGAYRGYGATQGIFALESIVDELAHKLDMDPVKLRELNMVKEGQVMPAYYNEHLRSCALDRCMAKAKEMMHWDEKYPYRDMGNGKVRSVGAAMAMQGSGISNVDVGSVTLKVNDDGFYTMAIGAADMGTGCDTTLAQIVADCLECDVDDISVFGVDTDTSPYDSGSYASSTAYVTGGAAVKASKSLKKRILQEASRHLGVSPEQLDFDGKQVFEQENPNNCISLKDVANKAMCFSNTALEVTESNSQPVSPPPFMVGMAEVEIDMETGAIELIDYVAVVDCGTPLNPALVKVQTEGGLGQGIGMALYEDVIYNEKGKDRTNSFMQYKIPTRLDVGTVRVDFESSYEPTGPFGAKSIGEVVINTPSPAIANAVYNATKVRIRELPITAEKIAKGMGKF